MNQELENADLLPDKDARIWAMMCHLVAFSGYLIPFGNLIGPLVIWALKRNESPFIDDQGKEAINFQITMSIAALVSTALTFVLIGFLLLAILCIYNLVLVIVASIKANNGEWYRYPFTIRLVK